MLLVGKARVAGQKGAGGYRERKGRRNAQTSSRIWGAKQQQVKKNADRSSRATTAGPNWLEIRVYIGQNGVANCTLFLPTVLTNSRHFGQLNSSELPSIVPCFLVHIFAPLTWKAILCVAAILHFSFLIFVAQGHLPLYSMKIWAEIKIYRMSLLPGGLWGSVLVCHSWFTWS